ncbi:hypothetical protein GJAV_G00154510 [Gymnothorax javanicus]|nr:hypothetical protein GJAV_G00154510 [Gymnothorax javanicus]
MGDIEDTLNSDIVRMGKKTISVKTIEKQSQNAWQDHHSPIARKRIHGVHSECTFLLPSRQLVLDLKIPEDSQQWFQSDKETLE